MILKKLRTAIIEYYIYLGCLSNSVDKKLRL